ncbi:SulP family inorganic anion transporter [Paenibacillus sp. J2TS4]|uniref:SulP family inorganic anion transporter n=1 Tax=Paenibacillus sp. J2TS4 TaxID=2807194 RepID=UPI001B16980D|nr:sulfate permease [Paenibacillus sp. J2TS4]GIP33200.1 sodium-independent anion transporter [Paenibacillus sp. J2TS4]
MKRITNSRWEGYRLSDLRKDFISGVTVGVIAIPLGMAFAIASGVKPEYGLYTTIVAGIVIALLGGSRFQVGGPTGAFIPILLAIVLQYGYENLLIAGFMAGILLVVMGLLKLGTVIQYIPRPVTIGFTSGIAVIIFTGQVGNFLGLTGLEQSQSFIGNVLDIGRNLHTVQWSSVATAAVSLGLLLAIGKWLPKVPASLVSLIGSALFAAILFGDQIATIGSEFGAIPGTLPALHMPQLTWDKVVMLLGPAVTIALLGAIESLLSAVVADGMSGTRHNSNRELLGQGAANIITPLFGGIPATGAIARTAANIKSGAVSPLSAIIHGITVLIILLLFAPYASRIPLAGMAPILMLVSWNMSSRRHFMQLIRMRNGDSAVALVAFILTVFVNLTIAVGIGLVLAALLFIKRMSELLAVTKVMPAARDTSATEEGVQPSAAKEPCAPIRIYAVEGPLFFGAAQYFLNTLMDAVRSKPEVLILDLERMPFIDATGEANLHVLVRHFQGNDCLVLITGIQHQPREMLIRSGLYPRIGQTHFLARTKEAVDYALTQLDVRPCDECQICLLRQNAKATD